MGRDTLAKHLLDTDADQNVGNSAIIMPRLGPATTIAATNPERILQLSGPSPRGQTTSVIFTASKAVSTSPGYAGPITGIVEFGNGGRFTRVEVDVPLGPYIGFFQGAFAASEPQDGGVVVTVPTGVLRAYARYDNLLIQSCLGGPPYSFAEKKGVSFIGPGGPHTDPSFPTSIPPGPPGGGPPGIVVPAEPVQVKAMAAYYTRHFARAYKTDYCYVGDTPGGVAIPDQWIDGSKGQMVYCIPAFAKSVQVFRFPTTAALSVVLYDGINALSAVPIASGASPIIPIVGPMTVISIQSDTANDKIRFLALTYEIGL